MNRMEEVAKMFGLELGEQFNVGVNRFSTNAPYMFTKNGIADSFGGYNTVLLEAMIRGEVPIQKLPFKPKKNYKYWTLGIGKVFDLYWNGDMADLENYKLGIVFRTKKQAEEKLSTYKQELEEYYKNN